MADFDDMPPLVERPAFLLSPPDDLPPLLDQPFSLFPHDDLPPLVERPNVDDMPPLVDRPPSLTMMTYTFGHDLTPITYTTEPTRFEVVSEDDAPRICAPSPPAPDTDTVHGGVTRTSHAKKRDESYIPRPPNAFILFRSSFIKSQQIPGKIEGNHSTLSKIIGMVWKGLPRDEREHWEAEAIKAQAEHRARYPHWRFRPAANAMAKVKDGPPERKNKNKKKEGEEIGGTKGAGKRGRARVQKDRCETIAGFLSKGMTGDTLESAVKAWDEESKVAMEVAVEDIKIVQESPLVKETKDIEVKKAIEEKEEPMRTKTETVIAQNASTVKARSASPADDARFMTPLTSMFRRSSSVPVPPLSPLAAASPSLPSQSTASPWAERRGSFSSYDGSSPVLGLQTLTSSQYTFEYTSAYSSSPPGSPYSTVSSPTDLGAPAKDAFLSNSSYSSLCGWAGDPAPPAVYSDALGYGNLFASQGSQGTWACDGLAMLPTTFA